MKSNRPALQKKQKKNSVSELLPGPISSDSWESIVIEKKSKYKHSMSEKVFQIRRNFKVKKKKMLKIRYPREKLYDLKKKSPKKISL